MGWRTRGAAGGCRPSPLRRARGVQSVRYQAEARGQKFGAEAATAASRSGGAAPRPCGSCGVRSVSCWRRPAARVSGYGAWGESGASLAAMPAARAPTRGAVESCRGARRRPQAATGDLLLACEGGPAGCRRGGPAGPGAGQRRAGQRRNRWLPQLSPGNAWDRGQSPQCACGARRRGIVRGRAQARAPAVGARGVAAWAWRDGWAAIMLAWHQGGNTGWRTARRGGGGTGGPALRGAPQWTLLHRALRARLHRTDALGASQTTDDLVNAPFLWCGQCGRRRLGPNLGPGLLEEAVVGGAAQLADGAHAERVDARRPLGRAHVAVAHRPHQVGALVVGVAARHKLRGGGGAAAVAGGRGCLRPPECKTRGLAAERWPAAKRRDAACPAAC
jgi:hypothetical protein